MSLTERMFNQSIARVTLIVFSNNHIIIKIVLTRKNIQLNLQTTL